MELNAERQQAAAELAKAGAGYAGAPAAVGAMTQAVSQQDLDTAATEMAVKQAYWHHRCPDQNVIGPR